MVVDSSAPERSVVRTALEPHGHRLAEASTGDEALDAMRADAFNIVFMAMDHPRVDGYVVAREMRTIPGGAAAMLIAILDGGDERGPFDSYVAGAIDLLIRPFGVHDLRLAVERATTPAEVERRRSLVGIQLNVYETALRLQTHARAAVQT